MTDHLQIPRFSHFLTGSINKRTIVRNCSGVETVKLFSKVRPSKLFLKWHFSFQIYINPPTCGCEFGVCTSVWRLQLQCYLSSLKYNKNRFNFTCGVLITFFISPQQPFFLQKSFTVCQTQQTNLAIKVSKFHGIFKTWKQAHKGNTVDLQDYCYGGKCCLFVMFYDDYLLICVV